MLNVIFLNFPMIAGTAQFGEGNERRISQSFVSIWEGVSFRSSSSYMLLFWINLTHFPSSIYNLHIHIFCYTNINRNTESDRKELRIEITEAAKSEINLYRETCSLNTYYLKSYVACEMENIFNHVLISRSSPLNGMLAAGMLFNTIPSIVARSLSIDLLSE